MDEGREKKRGQRAEGSDQTTADNDRMFYVDVLDSNGCACGDTKKPGKAFCRRCYKELPYRMQEALYNRIGQGFEEAYEAAVKWLQENV